MADIIDKQINSTMSDAEQKSMKKGKKAQEAAPVFKVVGESRIPVSKHLGGVWRERKETAMRMRQNTGVDLRWEQALRYVYNDQRPFGPDGRPVTYGDKKFVGSDVTEIENLIFANTNALVPAIYAKCPDIEITVVRTKSEQTESVEEEETHARIHERLIDELMRRQYAPGIDMHTKMKRATIQAHLTDRSYLQVEYVQKQDSSDTALQNLQDLSTKYKEAKDTKEINEIEGAMLALEKKINFLSPAGPSLRVRRAFDVIIDPASEMPNLSDANYVMVAEYMDMNLVNALYNEKDPTTGEWKTVYKGTHVVDAGDAGKRGDNINTLDYTNLIELKDTQSYNAFGFSNQEDFVAAQRILMWYVWDKTTRRVLLFADNNWSWPVWVWDDPYNLPGFYNLVPLYFNTDPEKQYSRSEVVYQLDMQDAINQCNSQIKKMRRLASEVFLYDDRLKNNNIDEIIAGSQPGPRGIPVKTNDGEIKLGDAIAALLPPSAQVKELFDKTSHIEAFNRLSSVTNVLRGVEYKTNTTNKAIESYEGGQQMRLDEKIDTIENTIAAVGLMIMHMCVQFMSAQEVKDITDMPEVDQLWEQMTPAEFDKKHAFKVVGGSAIKPTSKAKKEEASLAVQQLGQFASASPVAFLIALKVFEKAFDSNVITKEDFEMLKQSIMSQIDAQTAQKTGAQGSGPSQGGPQQGQQGNAPVTQGQVADLLKAIDSMPPEVKQRLGAEIADGKPIGQILQQLMAEHSKGATQ